MSSESEPTAVAEHEQVNAGPGRSSLGNRGIVRGRLFMGMLLLLAALLTWSIGLMMSPHAQTVVDGTEHVRTTVITFKRNGAIGTLVLCALAAWLLFPARRPKRPIRDFALIASFVFLAGSSIYTLIGLELSTLLPANADNNSSNAEMNVDLSNTSGTPSDAKAVAMNAPPVFQGSAAHAAISATAPKPDRHTRRDGQTQSTVTNVTEEPPEVDTRTSPPDVPNEPADATEENQE